MLRLLDFHNNREKRVESMLPLWLWLCLLLGGASQGGAIANSVLQVGGAALIALWLWNGTRLNIRQDEHIPFYLLIAAMVWIAIMFVPLPPTIWQLLPGRDFVAEGYRLLGMKLPWLSMAMAPDRALRSALVLLVPIATWLLVRRMDQTSRRRMAMGIAVIAAISAAIGLLQMSTGPNSVLRLYSPTNQDSPVGFFANTNHFSLFLACSLPLAAAWVATVDTRKPAKRKLLLGLGIFAALVATALIVGKSVAGLAFLVLGLIGTAHILWSRFASGRHKLVFVTGVITAALIAVAALTAIGTGTLGAKFENAPTSRSNLTPVTIAAGTDMAPTGSGLGSFAQVYAMHQPDRFTTTTWVNHAHNDYAELYLELGFPGLILVAIFLVWFLLQGYRIWQQRDDPNMLFAQAAWLSGSFMLLHSIVDYPLRTAAMAALFAAMIGLISRPPTVSGR